MIKRFFSACMQASRELSSFLAHIEMFLIAFLITAAIGTATGLPPRDKAFRYNVWL